MSMSAAGSRRATFSGGTTGNNSNAQDQGDHHGAISQPAKHQASFAQAMAQPPPQKVGFNQTSFSTFMTTSANPSPILTTGLQGISPDEIDDFIHNYQKAADLPSGFDNFPNNDFTFIGNTGPQPLTDIHPNNDQFLLPDVVGIESGHAPTLFNNAQCSFDEDSWISPPLGLPPPTMPLLSTSGLFDVQDSNAFTDQTHLDNQVQTAPAADFNSDNGYSTVSLTPLCSAGVNVSGTLDTITVSADSLPAGEVMGRILAMMQKQQQDINELRAVSASLRASNRDLSAMPNSNGRRQGVHGAEAGTKMVAPTRVTKMRKQRSALAPHSRIQTAETRDHGACIRCQRIKKKCPVNTAPWLPCLGCLSVSSSTLRIPCIRSRITESILFRLATSEKDTWSVRGEVYDISELATYTSPDTRVVELTHGHGGSLKVSVRPFSPIQGDVTSYFWADRKGATQEMAMPCFALSRLDQACEAISTFVDKNLYAYIQAYCDSNDFIIWNVFRHALLRAKHSNGTFIRNVLRLWMASRLIETPWRICGDDTLGLDIVTDPDNIFFGRIPVTPIMDTQLDRIVIQRILMPLKETVLKELQQRLLSGGRNMWFENFLVVFILLNNVELATAHDHEFAVMYGHVTPGRGCRFEDYSLIEKYFHSAQGMIAHFRDAAQGHIPFTSKDNARHLASKTDVEDQEIDFLSKLKTHIANKGTKLEKLRRDHYYESPSYWTHQLFIEQWEPDRIDIKELDVGVSELRGQD